MVGSAVVPNPSTPLALGFLVLVLVVAGLVVALVRRAGGSTARMTVGLALWLAATHALAVSGILVDAVPPKSMLLFVPALVLTLWFGTRSRAAAALVERAPLAALVGLQAFRLPLELLMHAWAEEGALPPQMTFAGQNWDILTGVAALLVAPFASRSRSLVWVWNILGLGLLFNIVSVAIMSVPGPLRVFLNDPPNVLVMRELYIWLPTFLVQVALAGHIIVIRVLIRRGRAARG